MLEFLKYIHTHTRTHAHTHTHTHTHIHTHANTSGPFTPADCDDQSTTANIKAVSLSTKPTQLSQATSMDAARWMGLHTPACGAVNIHHSSGAGLPTALGRPAVLPVTDDAHVIAPRTTGFTGVGLGVGAFVRGLHVMRTWYAP